MSVKRINQLVLVFFVAGAALSAAFGINRLLPLVPLILIAVGIIVFAYCGPSRSLKYWLVLASIGVVGFVAELIGVRTGLLFGDYAYGDVLGPKLAGTPLLLILLWSYVCMSAYVIASPLKPVMRRLIVAGLVAVLFDVMLEPFAIKTGLWYWSDGYPGLYNYVCWFVLAFLGAGLLAKQKIKVRNRMLATTVFAAEAVFFISILLIKEG